MMKWKAEGGRDGKGENGGKQWRESEGEELGRERDRGGRFEIEEAGRKK